MGSLAIVFATWAVNEMKPVPLQTVVHEATVVVDRRVAALFNPDLNTLLKGVGLGGCMCL